MAPLFDSKFRPERRRRACFSTTCASSAFAYRLAPPSAKDYSKSLNTSGMEFKTSLAITDAVVPISSAA